jgi:hypothetical protein
MMRALPALALLALGLALPAPAVASPFPESWCGGPLLDNNEALTAMNESQIVHLPQEQSDPGVLTCSFGGSTEQATILIHLHALLVEFSFFHALTHTLQFYAFESGVCYLSLDGCKLAKQALNADSNREAFRDWALAFKHAGNVRLLENGFRGDPALIWRLQHPPLADEAFALVYDEEIHTGLLVSCTEDIEGETSIEVPDTTCAVQALRRAYHNQATGLLPHPPHH